MHSGISVCAWEDCQEFWANLGYIGQQGLSCAFYAPQIRESTIPPPLPFYLLYLEGIKKKKKKKKKNKIYKKKKTPN